jgi:hypothetical protein
MAHLYFHLQMLTDLEMKIEINPSTPILGETNCWRTRGDYDEKQCAALRAGVRRGRGRGRCRWSGRAPLARPVPVHVERRAPLARALPAAVAGLRGRGRRRCRWRVRSAGVAGACACGAARCAGTGSAGVVGAGARHWRGRRRCRWN